MYHAQATNCGDLCLGLSIIILAAGQGIHVLRDPTRGGVGTALNEIADLLALRVESKATCTEVKHRAGVELGLVGLSDRAGDKVRRLSGGQMRRVEIARALLHRPRLLLLDEPTVGLDIDSRQAIQDRVRALCRDEGLAVLWATHLIDEVLPDSRVVVLHRGKVLASGTRDEVTTDTGAADIRAAFSQLTRDPPAAAGEAA